MTLDRDRFRSAAERSGLFGADYAEDVLVRLAHHSSAIEGNTLSLSDIITLLIDEVTPSGKSVREAYEVQNHREALWPGTGPPQHGACGSEPVEQNEGAPAAPCSRRRSEPSRQTTPARWCASRCTLPGG
ncbi:MAG: hypothetical protein QM733_18610 [Ilumatobacteraceae bacterium]